ncbi:hypothetical protein GCM10010123_03180 [Pilimelia anulata]|uniref:SCP domain-containing protein n=1 Tax=Pilimelia anulata TaxID=53371 RepID=A0A8J3B6Z9_9ACTN|nr:CAP domain-containing protein [Pilimelia anulata]GGJ76558.1 hypothetical protein GCM10010123_03180 [Pilimelia anulata]
MTRPFSRPGESRPLRPALLCLVAAGTAVALTGCAVRNDGTELPAPLPESVLAGAPVATPGPTTAAPTPTPSPTADRKAVRAAGRAGKRAQPVRQREPRKRPQRPVYRGKGSAQEQEVTRLINIEREKAGCGAVSVNDKLYAAAAGHSRDMADNDYFSHTGKDGRKPWDRARDAGYSGSYVSENIAMGGSVDAERVVDMWMSSKDGHRENILRCASRVTAVARAARGGTAYWTQMFG